MDNTVPVTLKRGSRNYYIFRIIFFRMDSAGKELRII